ncbi:MAG TPA: TrkA C-terminal domain-containing protein [Nitrospiria bacterium]|nr:TrkA C-terminal domain-containing protein [Nitrospiria bacterium]HUK56810.1 TrkA C-terminal domain-containing protein [Nitrospiria bacterium]
MKFVQRFRREIGLAWTSLEKVFVSTAEQTARQIEILRLSYQIHEHERALAAVFERMGRFLYEFREKNLEAITDHSTSQSCLSDFKRIQSELTYIERKRYDLQEENVSTKWAEFVESVYKSGMTLESIVLPFHLSPPSLTLQALMLPPKVLVIAVQRQERFIQPHGGVVLKRGDRLTLLGPPEQIVQVVERFAPSH